MSNCIVSNFCTECGQIFSTASVYLPLKCCCFRYFRFYVKSTSIVLICFANFQCKSSPHDSPPVAGECPNAWPDGRDTHPTKDNSIVMNITMVVSKAHYSNWSIFMAVLIWYMRNSIAIDSCVCTMCAWLVSLYGAPSSIALHQKYKYFSFYGIHLPHWCRVGQICGSKLTIIISDNGVLPRSAPSLYLNQCRNIVYWIPENKLQ